MTNCQGCGIVLQYEQQDQPGYARDERSSYCQSCFRLRHYRDFKHVRAEVDDGQTLTFIQSFAGHVFWVVDIMHLSQSLNHGLVRALRGQSVILVVNKRDLLPKSVSDSKLKQSIFHLLKEYDIDLADIVFVSALKSNSLDPLMTYINDSECALVGSVNAGKSSILNALLGKDVLSVSPVASTTASIIKIETEHATLYDTPGLRSATALIEKFTDGALVTLAPKKTIKPMVFQLYEQQSLVLGNLGAITLTPQKQISVVSYLPFPIKRVNPKRMLDNLALEHSFMIQSPQYRTKKWPVTGRKVDLELFDVGFITIQGDLAQLETIMDKDCEIILRKALI